MNLHLGSSRIQYEYDVVAARQRTRQIAEALGFDAQQQTRLATAVSEIARNAFLYAGGGDIDFSLEGATSPQLFCVRVSDRGQGIANVDEILEGRYRSETGMGLGIVGAQRLMDHFRIATSPGSGAVVNMGKLLPRRAPLITGENLPKIKRILEQQKPRDLLEDFREQNAELMRTLDELRRRQDELTRVNRELEETNRGVVALYAELDEKAEDLKRADQVKSRFLSNMSHEFRTPLNSILALSRLLLDRTDGQLTDEQEIQVTYIRKSAESLSELVNDLLDIAKVEAGKTEVRASEFEAHALFGALRGMLRPLLVSSSVALVFDDPEDVPPLHSDEGKISQILRNFISNALKFTEAGEVRIHAEYASGDDTVIFRVRDTGIGIAREYQETIFQEFAQLENPLQRLYKGSGLGLPLSRRLAELLGGSVGLESAQGLGSEFFLKIPRLYAAKSAIAQPQPRLSEKRPAVLFVDAHNDMQLLYAKHLRLSPWRALAARSIQEAEAILRHTLPSAIVLDVELRGEDSWAFLARLKSDSGLRSVPVIVAPAVNDPAKAGTLGADLCLPKPVSGPALRAALRRVTGTDVRNILIADDQEIARYLARQLFSGARVHFMEASDGEQALELARAEKPDLIFADLTMPRMNGFDFLKAIGADPSLTEIPVLVMTSRSLSPDEEAWLGSRSLAVLPKDRLGNEESIRTLANVLSMAGLEDLTEFHRRPVEAAAE